MWMVEPKSTTIISVEATDQAVKKLPKELTLGALRKRKGIKINEVMD